MIPKILRRFKLKSNTKQRDYVGIWQTNECYIIPLFSVENIMCKGNTYVRFGWLFWYLEYLKITSFHHDVMMQNYKETKRINKIKNDKNN